MVECPLGEQEVAGLNLGSAIPNALNLVPVANLLGAQHYKASTGFSSLTNIAQLTSHNLQNKSILIGGPYGRLAFMLNMLSA